MEQFLKRITNTHYQVTPSGTVVCGHLSEKFVDTQNDVHFEFYKRQQRELRLPRKTKDVAVGLATYFRKVMSEIHQSRH